MKERAGERVFFAAPTTDPSHAGVSERSNDQTSERQGAISSQHGEKGEAGSLGGEVVCMNLSDWNTPEIHPGSGVGHFFSNSCVLVNSSRPKCVDEVAFQEEVVAVLKKSLEGGNVCVSSSSQWVSFVPARLI